MSAEPAPTIYLLPGLDGTGELYAPLLAALPSASAQVVSYDPRTPRSWAAYAEQVAAAIDSSSPFLLLAESFSGPVALEFLSAHGANCRGLLACATFVSNPSPLRLALATLPGALHLAPRRLPQWALRRLLVGPQAPAQLCQRVAETIATIPRATLADRLGLLRALRPQARAFAFPVTYVRGNEDALVSQRSAAEFLAHVSGATYEQVPGPHLLAQAAPDLVAGLLARLSA